LKQSIKLLPLGGHSIGTLVRVPKTATVAI
jgi:hypothetical protein